MENKRAYKYCVVPKCSNTTVKTPNKIFFAVPRDAKIRNKWWRLMKRKDPLSNSTTAYCCEDHFDVEGDMENYIKHKLVGGMAKLKKNTIPHKFECQKNNASSEKPAFAKRRRIEHYEKVLSKEVPTPCYEDPEFVECGTVEEITADQNPIDVIPGEEGCDNISSKSIRRSNLNKSVQVNIDKKTQEKATNTATKKNNQSCKINVKSSELPKLNISLNSSGSNDTSSLYEVDTQSSLSDCSVESTVNFKNEMKKVMLKSILREPKLLLGLPKESYACIKLMSVAVQTSDLNIMITLKKIRLNESFSLLALHFGLSKSFVAKIFKKTLPLVASCMKDLLFFPPRQMVQKNLPIHFRNQYFCVESIIDCFEVQINKPSNAVQQALTWSSYKGCNTIKYLISITPDGLINYVSEGYGGRATDSCIVEDCDYLEKLPSGAVVLADRGFKNVAHLIEQKGCKLLRPPSVKSDVIPTKKEVLQTKTIAAVRVHVERAIGRLRKFGFLLPHACVDLQQVNVLDYVVITCCGMVNLHKSLFDLS